MNLRKYLIMIKLFCFEGKIPPSRDEKKYSYSINLSKFLIKYFNVFSFIILSENLTIRTFDMEIIEKKNFSEKRFADFRWGGKKI